MEYKYDFYWGLNPTELVINSSSLLKSNFKVLDLGCGEGRNSFFISEKVFHLTAVDISNEVISKITSNNKSNIKTTVSDALDFMKNSDTYDVIYCINLFHMLEQNKVHNLIDLIKQKTNSNGFNIVCSFYTESSEQKQITISKNRYLFDKDELKNTYKRWKLIHYNTPNQKNVELITQKCNLF